MKERVYFENQRNFQGQTIPEKSIDKTEKNGQEKSEIVVKKVLRLYVLA